MATGYEKYVQRVGHTTKHMSKRLPKPNVCRIEVMDGPARQAYMGGFQSTIDAFRSTMLEKIAENGKYDLYEPFYGILDTPTGNGPSFKVTAQWTTPSSNKSGFARMSSLLTGSGGKSGLLGAIPIVGQGLSFHATNLLDNVEALAQHGMELSGVNNNTTGSMTIKKFTKGEITASIPLKFKWYLPEQEDMCRMSLKRLVMMTYVRPMDMRGAEIVNETINGIMNAGGTLKEGLTKLSEGITSSVSDVANTARGAVGESSVAGQMIDQAGTGAGMIGSMVSEGLSQLGGLATSVSNSSVVQGVANVAKSVAGAGIDTYNSLNSFFGGEIVANPLPVRVSIGHYLDLEPMVIDSVNISASTEQFVSADGTHLPVFMMADVQVSYWMQPGPTKDFISILGNEVFGEYVDRPDIGAVGKNKTDGSVRKNNNPNKNKKR